MAFEKILIEKYCCWNVVQFSWNRMFKIVDFRKKKPTDLLDLEFNSFRIYSEGKN